MKANGKVLTLPRAVEAPAVTDPGVERLGRLLAAYAPHDGSFELGIRGLHASRMSRANMECFHTLRLPCLCIIAQGAKTVIVGSD